MPFGTDTVHGLSADVYFDSNPVRVMGDVVVSLGQEILDLTANDEGQVEPVDTLRRGDRMRVTVPISDALGLATVSGVVLPFATAINGASGVEVLFPKAVPGDSFLDKAKELRLVTRNGAATYIFPKAVAVEVADLTLSETAQAVQAVTFACFRDTVSGIETPVRMLSGSVVTGP